MSVNIIVGGNIFDSKMQTLTNPVNCVGVMGKGLALAFKHRYPLMYLSYIEACKSKALDIGHPQLYKSDAHQWILNFPTKNHWKQPSELNFISIGLQYLVDNYERDGITSLAMPSLGCGLGGLSINVIKPMLIDYSNKMTNLQDIEIYV